MTIAVWARSNRKVKSSTTTWDIKWIAVNLLVILLSCFIYVWLSMQNIQVGYQITEALQAQKQLKERNHVLQLQWTHYTSPAYLKSRAKELRLQVPTQIVSLR
ncbi:MAG: hypothetical protein LWW94_01400 [Candidatus Desulfofervidaceae bacterium]|nr:hypothetical protein [Candidatus Desulfofervidaceae bacterium]